MHEKLKTQRTSAPKRAPIRTIGPSIAYIPLTRGQFALIDADCPDYVYFNNWHASFAKTANSFYANSTHGELHRALMGFPNSQVDHRNGNSLDNRMCNLRTCTAAQNQWNMKRPKNNTSGYKGVSYLKEERRWVARLSVNKKIIVIGRFYTRQRAYEAYCREVAVRCGEFARTE